MLKFKIRFISSIIVVGVFIILAAGSFDDSSRSGSSGSSSSSSGRKCLHCNKPISGRGFSTAAGQEFECETMDCGYCSRSCAKAARPQGW